MRHLIVLAAAVLVASSAAAQPGPPEEGERPHMRLFLSPSGEPFRGGDGLQAWFARADADHDGALTLAEFQADALVLFHQLDKDKDGRLDGFELQAYEREVAPEIGGLVFDEEGGRGFFRMRPPGGRGGGPGGGREGAGRYSLLNIPQPVLGADLDVDGRVTLDEWKRAAALRFGLLDTAKAGRLPLASLPPLPGARVEKKR